MSFFRIISYSQALEKCTNPIQLRMTLRAIVIHIINEHAYDSAERGAKINDLLFVAKENPDWLAMLDEVFVELLQLERLQTEKQPK